MATYWSVYWSYITHRLEFVFVLHDSEGTSFSPKLSICIRMYAAPSKFRLLQCDALCRCP